MLDKVSVTDEIFITIYYTFNDIADPSSMQDACHINNSVKGLALREFS